MVERHNKISGGHFSGPVVQAGSIDQLTVHLGDAAAGQVLPLTSWPNHRESTPPLRDLLEAQHRATESLLEQHNAAAESASGEQALTLTEALNRNRHLVITSERAGIALTLPPP